MSKPSTVLCILDGFGLNPNPKGNAVALAKKPNFDGLLRECPHSTLVTYGERVGLPAGQMGNSEVGHLNIGAGRVVEQWLLRIGRALSGDFLENSASYQAFLKNSRAAKNIHLIGLFSDGGVHSHSEHLLALLAKLPKNDKQQICLHLITDGRDTSPKRAYDQVRELESKLSSLPHVKIKSVCGRFFAMDRDNRWERVEKAWRCWIQAKAKQISSASQYIKECYQSGIGDEFIEPAVLDPSPAQTTDAFIFWNFREDRMRQAVRAVCLDSFAEFDRNGWNLPKERVLCFTDYDHTFGLPYLFEQLSIEQHLGQVVSEAGLKQLRVAETEKYPHVTYFLNGGVEKSFEGEERKIVPSPRDVKTYDLKPEMSAVEVCDHVVQAIHSSKYALIVVNFANCDMVGHSGVLEAGIKAVETVDSCLGRILEALSKERGQAVIIADHGNAEYMINYEDNTPNTAHTTFPVPVVIFGYAKDARVKADGALCDVAPTVLKMMGLPQPALMSGKTLIETVS